MIKVVDIFAGPGGLSEGFASVTDSRGRRVFDVVLSIEKDSYALRTLRLRAFFRRFPEGAPVDYYRFLRGEISQDELYARHSGEAKIADVSCWHAELGSSAHPVDQVRERIDHAVGKCDRWVLIGGPPCQAYSIAGRSRNRGNPEYDPEKDGRQRLYVEYLQILGDHQPSVFIMENVKGLLSATLDNEGIFHRITEDLRNPLAALRREGRSTRHPKDVNYHIFSLVEQRMFENGDLRGSVIEAERYGIPQARHRVILVGVRNDLGGVRPKILKRQATVTVSSVLSGMPPLRSGLSRQKDSAQAWRACLRSQVESRWATSGTCKADGAELSEIIRNVLRTIEPPDTDRGGEFIPREARCEYASQWYCDNRIGGVCNHSARSHMEKDLYRYLYAACYGRLHAKSPSLRRFPTDLLPDHVNVDLALTDGGNFSDRFRVQVATRPSTTIVSHIGKDGHYYIHPDPMQCRSLTVREAARLQTFPDNYFFCGPRTPQYIQVGNAVPPLLAKQIGEIVRDILGEAGVNP